MIDLQKTKWILSILSILYWNSWSCDICNSGASNTSSSSIGGLHNYIGLQYQYLHFNYKETIASDSPIAQDKINTMQLVGQYYLTKKININWNIPYQYNIRENSTEKVERSGLGDISFTSNYKWISHNENHHISLGLGLKLPTGKFDLVRANQNQTSANQIGTGSLDVLLPLQYSFVQKKYNWSISGQYSFKGKNEYDYQYGNQIHLETGGNYILFEKKHALEAGLNLSYDHFGNISRFDIEDDQTDGYMVNTKLNLTYKTKNWVFGGYYQIPITQNLLNDEVSFQKSLGVLTYYQF